MPRQITLKTYFLKVVLPEGTTGRDLHEGMKRASALSGGPMSRRIRNGATPIQIDTIAQHPDHTTWWEGNISKGREFGVPVRLKLRDGGRESFGIGAGEAAGEDSAFLYNGDIGVLALQNPRKGLTPSMLTEFFKAHPGIACSFSLQYMMDLSGLERLDSLERVTSLQLSMALVDPRYAAEWASENSAAGSFRDLVHALNSRSVTLSASLGPGRQSGTLLKEAVRNLSEAVLSLGSLDSGGNSGEGKARKLSIAGYEEDGARSAFDLIARPIFEPHTETLGGRYGEAPYSWRRSLVRDAHERRFEELGRMIGHTRFL